MAFIEININGKPLIESISHWFYCFFHNTCPKCCGSGELLKGHVKGNCGGGFYVRCDRCWGSGTYFKSNKKKSSRW